MRSHVEVGRPTLLDKQGILICIQALPDPTNESVTLGYS